MSTLKEARAKAPLSAAKLFTDKKQGSDERVADFARNVQAGGFSKRESNASCAILN